MVKPLQHKLWRDVRRHRAQFIAITLTMFLGVTIFGATYDSFQNLTASYETTATEYRFANLTVAGGDVAAFAQASAMEPGVESAELRTSTDIPFRVDGTKLLGRAIGLPADDQPAVNQIEVLTGTYLDPTLPDGVLVEQHMADHFGLSPGSTVEVLDATVWRTMTVVGTVASPEYIWTARDRQNIITTPDNFGVIFAAEQTVRELAATGPNEVVSYYAAGVENEELTASLSATARSLGATNVYTRAEQASNAALEEDLAGFEQMAVFFPIMFLLAAGMAAYVMISRTPSALTSVCCWPTASLDARYFATISGTGSSRG